MKVMNLDGLKSSYTSPCGSSSDCSAGNGDALAGIEGIVFMFLHEQLSPWHLKASAQCSCCRAIWMTIVVYQHTIPV